MVPHVGLRRTALLFSFVVFALSPIAARTHGETAPVKAWQLEGRTVDADGRPLAGVRVFVAALPYLPVGNEWETTSDADGLFRLELLHRANYRMVRAIHPAGALESYYQTPYDLESQASPPPVELVLRPTRNIDVRVVDANQQPIAETLVFVMSGYQKFEEATTDSDGRVSLRVPGELPLQYVVALKAGVGIDYRMYRGKDEPTSDPYRLAPDHAEPLTMVLGGTRTVGVRVVDNEDQPLAGVRVYPWYFERHNKGGDLNIGGVAEFQATTDQSGVATFNTIPTDNTKRINFWVRADGYFSPERHMFDPASGESEVTAKLVPLVRIAGRVVNAGGQSAADIEVLAASDGFSMDSFRDSTRTDANGQFEFQGYPDQYYQLAAGNREWASPPVNKIVRAGQPVDDIELTLRPATRVFGRLTIGSNSAAMPDQYVELYQEEAVSYYDLPEAEQLPNPTDSNKAVVPRIVKSGKTNELGQFEFFTGPGAYYLIARQGIEPPKFGITDQRELEINLHAERPATITTSGRVVLRTDPEHGVAEATVTGYTLESLKRDLRAVSDSGGQFQAERGTSEMIVYAATQDRALAGITKIGAEDREFVIAIGPTGGARGRLMDEETAQPIADRRIEYGVWIEFTDKTFAWRFGGNTNTDADGQFTIDKLIPGQEYVLEAVTETDGEGNSRSWQSAGKVTVKSANAVEQIGELKLPAPYRELTTEERVAKAFAATKTLDEQLKARLRDAPLGYQRVLLVVGSAESALVRQFYRMEYDRTHEAVATALLDYLLLPVNTGESQRVAEALELASQLNFDLPESEDATLVVLDEKGATVGQVLCSNLAGGSEIDATRLFEFLDAHRPQLPDAEELLATALGKAKRDDKRVLVQVSGPRCGWCLVLSRYLDDHGELFDKEFAYVKLDGRLDRGQAVIDRLRPKREGGIPWMVILDADGQPLITSDAADGNIGYPGEPASRLHFEKMLRSSVRHLTEGDIKQLIDVLAKGTN